MKTVHGVETEVVVDQKSSQEMGELERTVGDHLSEDNGLKMRFEAECSEARSSDEFISLDVEESKTIKNTKNDELQDVKKDHENTDDHDTESISPNSKIDSTTRKEDNFPCEDENKTEQIEKKEEENSSFNTITKPTITDVEITTSDSTNGQDASSQIQTEIAETEGHDPKPSMEATDSTIINSTNNSTPEPQLVTAQSEGYGNNYVQQANTDSNENSARMATEESVTHNSSPVGQTDGSLGKQCLNIDKVEENDVDRSVQSNITPDEQDLSYNPAINNSQDSPNNIDNDISNELFNTEDEQVTSTLVTDEQLPNEERKGVESLQDIISTNNCAKKAKNRPHRVSFSEAHVKKIYDNEAFVSDEGETMRKGEFETENSLKKSFNVCGDNGNSKNAFHPQEIDILKKYGPGEKWRILRNVFLVSLGFMFMFTAFFGAANLQSSVNSKAGLGTVSLMGVYAGLIISNMFVPVMVIRWLGCKWTVALGMLTFAPYAVSQFHAEFYTMVPTALLAGIGGAPMWCAKCTYLNVAADAYAKVTGVAPELVMVRFFGLFYVLFPLGHVWGNLISSEVLSSGVTGPPSNITEDVLELCGANFCPGVDVSVNSNLQRPPDHQINTIAGIFVGCMIFASVLVAVGVDNLKRYNEGAREDSGSGLSGIRLLAATLKLLCNRNQLLLIPITAFIGVSQAFLGADFTEGYISCSWGIRHIGYVLLGYGLASSLASVMVSWVVKTVGRLVVICSSISLFLLLVAVMKFWRPHPDQGVVFFALAALWGMADSTALVINAMYGLLFRGNEAAAYSNFSLWGSAGFIITYSYSPHLCMNVKLAILAAILILSLVGFIIVEFTLRRILIEQQEQEKSEKNTMKTSIKHHPL